MKKSFTFAGLETKKLSKQNMRHSRGGFVFALTGLFVIGGGMVGTLVVMASLKDKR